MLCWRLESNTCRGVRIAFHDFRVIVWPATFGQDSPPLTRVSKGRFLCREVVLKHNNQPISVVTVVTCCFTSRPGIWSPTQHSPMLSQCLGCSWFLVLRMQCSRQKLQEVQQMLQHELVGTLSLQCPIQRNAEHWTSVSNREQIWAIQIAIIAIIAISFMVDDVPATREFLDSDSDRLSEAFRCLALACVQQNALLLDPQVRCGLFNVPWCINEYQHESTIVTYCSNFLISCYFTVSSKVWPFKTVDLTLFHHISPDMNVRRPMYVDVRIERGTIWNHGELWRQVKRAERHQYNRTFTRHTAALQISQISTISIAVSIFTI